MTEKVPVYLQRTDCTENEVNKLIQLGYTPWSITPVQKIITKGAHVVTETNLIYHFLKRKEK